MVRSKSILILGDGEEQVNFVLIIRLTMKNVKEVESNGVFVIGGVPSEANPTSAPCFVGNVKQEPKAGTKLEVKQKKAWRDKMNRALALRNEKGKEKAKAKGLEVNSFEDEIGGDDPRTGIVTDPLSEASCSQS
ncbi:unnamed protein product [Linum trigynum]|uniref:Uncharacterized protein n=1 Tax=Linum trigynum TaxID=586398 RepID=A0AAV2E868_9ROSI